MSEDIRDDIKIFLIGFFIFIVVAVLLYFWFFKLGIKMCKLVTFGVPFGILLVIVIIVVIVYLKKEFFDWVYPIHNKHSHFYIPIDNTFLTLVFVNEIIQYFSCLHYCHIIFTKISSLLLHISYCIILYRIVLLFIIVLLYCSVL